MEWIDLFSNPFSKHPVYLTDRNLFLSSGRDSPASPVDSMANNAWGVDRL